MKKFIYETHIIGGIFKFREVKVRNIQNLCNKMGENGWKLDAMTYDWFFVSYTLVFKKQM